MVALQLGSFLRDFVAGHRLDTAFGAETGFKIESDPDLVRAPAVSFVRVDRLRDGVPEGFIPGVPDLAVEVVSPSDSRAEVSAKKNLWLAHGTQSVRIVDPAQFTVSVYRVGRDPLVFGHADTLVDEPLLRGFSLLISRVFYSV